MKYKAVHHSGEVHRPQIQTDWVWILAFPLYDLSVLQFPHLQIWDNNSTSLTGLLWDLNELLSVQYLEQRMAHHKSHIRATIINILTLKRKLWWTEVCSSRLCMYIHTYAYIHG